MKSTKFFTTIVAMVCVTVIQGILLWMEHFEYTEWYYGFMIAASGVYVGSKTYQNLSYKENGGQSS